MENRIGKYITEYYDDYIIDSKTSDYYPPEYKEYFDKYDNDILETHCKDIVEHHLDISKYIIDIHDCHNILIDRMEAEEKKNKSSVRKFLSKMKRGFLTFITSRILINLYFVVVLAGFALRACIVDNNFSFFTGLALAVALIDAYEVVQLLIEVKIKKTKTFSQCSLYQPKDRVKEFANLTNRIYDSFYNYLKVHNTIPERKLIEVMRKNPCMYNDKAFFGLYLMSKQSISIFDAAELVDDSAQLMQAYALDIDDIYENL